MNTLKYVKTSDLTLDIDLHNGYSVRIDSIYNHNTKRYDATFYIKENTIETYMAIDTLNCGKVSFGGNRKTIKTDILKYTSFLLSRNYFDDAIKHYEYEVRCFDRGNALFEREKIYDVENE